MFKKLLIGLSPAQAGAVLATAIATVIGAAVLAYAFKRWNARTGGE